MHSVVISDVVFSFYTTWVYLLVVFENVAGFLKEFPYGSEGRGAKI